MRIGSRALRRGRAGPAPAWELPASILELSRAGPSALSRRAPEPGEPLRICTLVPSFRRGSGGHATIVHLMRELHGLGHQVVMWLEDFEGRHARQSPTGTQRSFAEFFAAEGLELQVGFGAWEGADVVLATGWQTVPRALLLGDVAGRAYLVQDHESEFYGASAQALFAAGTYRQGLHCIAASPWLAALLRSRYHASASHFDLAVDHAVYRPGDDARREDLVVFYARTATPRRAVPLGLLALEELARRRPGVEIALFGDEQPPAGGAGYVDHGILDPRRLAALYRQATVGLALSLTNPSLAGLEMMACGLPCVELASESMLASFGADGPLRLAAPDPVALCTAVERLLDEPVERQRMRRLGLELIRERTWRRAAQQVEAGLWAALERQVVPPAQPAG